MVSAHHHPPAPPSSPLKPLIAGGLMFAVLGLLVDFQGKREWLTPAHATREGNCEAIVKTDARLSRQELAELLAIPERDAKERVREVLSEPYCRLPGLNVRSGVVAEREVYPLEFDPTTQLVILYENDEYAGYRFSFE